MSKTTEFAKRMCDMRTADILGNYDTAHQIEKDLLHDYASMASIMESISIVAEFSAVNVLDSIKRLCRIALDDDR